MTFRLLLAGLLLALAACVGNDQPGAARDTAPMPELADGLRSLGSGLIDIALDPGQTRDLDPLNMAINLGITPPACADFALAFTWGLRLPNPAGDAKVGFAGERMGGRFEVAAAAPSGSAAIGCALLQAVNESRVPVVVRLRFVVATSRR